MTGALTKQMTIIDEIEAAIRQAAGKSTVTMIRLAIGKGLSVSKVEIAKELHKKFPSASVELEEGKETESVVVRDIEVE